MSSTSEIGDAFEAVIYDYFDAEISAGRFYIRQDFCQIFKKKGYFSRDRGKKIIFDVSIEVTLPGRQSYSFLILIECKDLSRAVSVDDAEEFFAKIDQVAGKNVKGIIASTKSFRPPTGSTSTLYFVKLLAVLDKHPNL